MLSDERIRQIAMEYWSGTCGTRVPDMEKAIRAAIAEAAQVPVMDELSEDIPQNWKGVDGAVAWHLIDRHCDGWQSVGLRMNEWASANFVPVIGEAVAYGVPNSAITGMRHRLMQVMLDIPKQAQYPELLVPLFEKPATSITQAELDALRNAARALNALLDRELHILDKEVVFPFESHTQAWNHIVDARQIADKAMAIAKERQS